MNLAQIDDFCAHIAARTAGAKQPYQREIASIEWVAELMGSAAVRSGPDHVTIGDATLSLRSLKVLLDCRDPVAQFEVVVARVERALAEQKGPDRAVTVADVFPRLRPPPDVADLPWHASIADGRLLECLVSDEQDTVRYLDPLRITGFGLGVAGLRRRARMNLRLLDHQLVPLAGEPGAYLCQTNDGHDAARLLMADELFPDLERVLCFVPDRDMLICAPADGPAAPELAIRMRQMAIQRANSAAYPICAEAFMVQGEEVKHLPFVRIDGVFRFEGLEGTGAEG